MGGVAQRRPELVGDVRRGGVQAAQQDAEALDQRDLTPAESQALKSLQCVEHLIAPETTVLYCMRW